MPKLKWRVSDAPFMNDPLYTAPIDWQDNQGGHPTDATPTVPAPQDRREHASAGMGKGLEGQVQ